MVNYNVRCKMIKIAIYDINSTVKKTDAQKNQKGNKTRKIWIVTLLVIFFLIFLSIFNFFYNEHILLLCSKQINFSSNIMLFLFSEFESNSWFQIIFSIHMALCRISKFPCHHQIVYACLVKPQLLPSNKATLIFYHLWLVVFTKTIKNSHRRLTFFIMRKKRMMYNHGLFFKM